MNTQASPLSAAIDGARRSQIEQISAATGVAPAHVRQWGHTGNRNLAPWVCRAIARTLKLDVDELFDTPTGGASKALRAGPQKAAAQTASGPAISVFTIRGGR